MRLIIAFVLSVSWLAISCSNSKSENHKLDGGMASFLTKIQVVPIGYRYDLILQDDENFYKTTKVDSFFFPEDISVIGLLSDTVKYYSILYLDPGDDLYPSIKVFSKSGSLIEAKPVSYVDCAAGDCGVDSCKSIIEVVGSSSIKRFMRMVTTKCDSLGNKIKGTEASFEKSQVAIISSSGRIEFGTEN